MTTTPIATPKNAATTLPRDPERETSNGKPTVPALPADLASLSDELLALRVAEGRAEQQRRRDKREADFLAYVKEHAQALGIQPARLMAVLGKRARQRADPKPMPASASVDASAEEDGRRHVRPKYRNPKDASQSWSGRGAPPAWVADHLAAGGTKEDLAIPTDAV